MKRYTFFFLMMMLVSTVSAQRIIVHAPARVAAGETFKLEYTINSTDMNGGLQIGKMPEGLEVVYGPSVSQQQSYTVVNGHASSSASITYTYMLLGTRSGTFTIPAAHVHVNGKTISSHPVKITVSGSNTNGNNPPRMHDDYQNDHQMRSAGSAISGNDLFIKVSPYIFILF